MTMSESVEITENDETVETVETPARVSQFPIWDEDNEKWVYGINVMCTTVGCFNEGIVIEVPDNGNTVMCGMCNAWITPDPENPIPDPEPTPDPDPEGDQEDQPVGQEQPNETPPEPDTTEAQ